MKLSHRPTYTYLGDRLTDPRFRRQSCEALRNAEGKCVRGPNGSMLVQFANGPATVVIGRLLRRRKD